MVFDHEQECASNELRKPCIAKSKGNMRKQNKMVTNYTEQFFNTLNLSTCKLHIYEQHNRVKKDSYCH